jgi:hypothetical protein
MKTFNKFSQVIAIKDAPIVNSPTHLAKQFGNVIQAYKKGDKFEVMSSFVDEIVIWHPVIGSTMACDSDNFELLEEFRDKQINKIL